jgi:hypothetical protein
MPLLLLLLNRLPLKPIPTLLLQPRLLWPLMQLLLKKLKPLLLTMLPLPLLPSRPLLKLPPLLRQPLMLMLLQEPEDQDLSLASLSVLSSLPVLPVVSSTRRDKMPPSQKVDSRDPSSTTT